MVIQGKDNEDQYFLKDSNGQEKTMSKEELTAGCETIVKIIDHGGTGQSIKVQILWH